MFEHHNTQRIKNNADYENKNIYTFIYQIYLVDDNFIVLQLFTVLTYKLHSIFNIYNLVVLLSLNKYTIYLELIFFNNGIKSDRFYSVMQHHLRIYCSLFIILLFFVDVTTIFIFIFVFIYIMLYLHNFPSTLNNSLLIL